MHNRMANGQELNEFEECLSFLIMVEKRGHMSIRVVTFIVQIFRAGNTFYWLAHLPHVRKGNNCLNTCSDCDWHRTKDLKLTSYTKFESLIFGHCNQHFDRKMNVAIEWAIMRIQSSQNYEYFKWINFENYTIFDMLKIENVTRKCAWQKFTERGASLNETIHLVIIAVGHIMSKDH